jgi:diguanylate cyclase (GGDEF)-like protein
MIEPRRDTPRVTVVLQRVESLDARSRPLVVGAACVLVLVIGYLESVPGSRLNYLALYLLPLALAVWYGGTWAGVAAALLSVAVWWIGRRLGGGGPPRSVFVEAWNAGARSALFLVFVYTLATLRRTLQSLADALKREHDLARMDGLTGIRNAHAFRESADAEVARSTRYGRPVTLAYIDADGFKGVNDRLGHSAGDRVLRIIAQTLAAKVRAVDVVARLGGDEFGVLLPETGPDAALAVLRKLHPALNKSMVREGVPVTFCIGAVTSMRPPKSVDELLQRADALMYEVKRAGKNGVRTEVLDHDTAAGPDFTARRGATP